MRFHSAAINDRRRHLRRTSAHAVFAALVGLAAGGCASIPQLSHKAVLTPTEQAGLGAVAVSELLGTAQPSQDQQQIAVTSSIGQRLAAASARSDVNWDFKVVQHARPIAVALPDGTVLLTDTLLARCRTEAELAAVLAKEMGCMLAGVYPPEVTWAPGGYTPLELGTLTPADQGPAKPEDLQAADSIGLSLLVSAGYDPSAAMTAWLQPTGSAPADSRRAQANTRRPNAAQEQSFTKSLTQARTIYQSHSAKLGSGSPLAFAAARPPIQSPPSSATPTPTPRATAQSLSPAPTPVRNAATSVPAPSRPISQAGNTTEFSSDGDFLPPTVASDRPGDGRWSSADETADTSRTIQQTSFEEPQGPTLGPALP